MTGEHECPGPCPGPGWELAIDPHDPYANGGEAPWEADAPLVQKWRRIGSAGKVRAAGDGLGNWNPHTGRFE